ncbi:hypothetical protein M9458_040035, partial [Cirrhinus mrigala]
RSAQSMTLAPSSKDGPQEDFAAFVECTLPLHRLASLDPAPSPPAPRCEECMPEPTTDGKPEPATTDEPSPHGATEPRISVEKAVASDITEGISAHCNMAEGKLVEDLGLLEAGLGGY